MTEELVSERFHLHYRSDIIENTLIWESHCHAGFELIGAYSDFDFTAATDDSERIYIAARCIKNSH